VQTEQREIASFLSGHPPFDALAEETLNQMASQVEVTYAKAGTDILNLSDPIHDLYVVRSGAVETFRRNGELYNRLAEGGIFGHMGLLMNERVRFPVKALEDSLLYCIPAELFRDYCDRFERFAEYFEGESDSLLHRAVASQQDKNDLTSVKVKTLITRPLISVPRSTTVRAVAETMTEHHLSSLLITEQGQDDTGKHLGLVGVVTDMDLRSQILAKGLPFDTPVDEIMSTEPFTLDHNAYVFEATLAMLRHHVHHLPILEKGRPLGVLTLSDLMRHEFQSSLLLVRSISTQLDRASLAQLAQQVSGAFVRMVKEDANSHMIGSAMSVIGRSFKQRLLELAEEQLGPPPVPYCFLALGSMARDEQLIYTDQDNALVLDDSYRVEQHGDYFAQLASYVSDGLAECGYTYCDGGVMATNPEWRKTLSEWKAHFAGWIDDPSPQALLNSSIFFDLDGVAGRVQWSRHLLQFITARTRNHRRFLACMARNALKRTPPLGFFKDFVLEKGGDHNNSINLKRRGTAPLSDVIRVHALAIGSTAVNSFERLDDIMAAGLLPAGKGRELSDALEYIAMVRIRHQARLIEEGSQVNNNLRPEDLSNFERRNLKEAFQVLSNAQSFLRYRYNSNMPSL
jgi:CBS domain-containing protein